MKKTAFLILTLAIPVGIFLFLKIFGTNTFEVPVLYENGIPGCPETKGPFHIPDFKYKNDASQINIFKGTDDYAIFSVIDPENSTKFNELLVQLVRIQDAFYETGSPSFILMNTGDFGQTAHLKFLCAQKGLNPKKCLFIFMEPGEREDFLTCGLGLKDNDELHLDNLILIDRQRRIRGKYNVFETEETDKLILELKILKEEEK
jgi:protein SCO1